MVNHDEDTHTLKEIRIGVKSSYNDGKLALLGRAVLTVGIVRFYTFKLTFLLKIRLSPAIRFTQLMLAIFFSRLSVSSRTNKIPYYCPG